MRDLRVLWTAVGALVVLVSGLPDIARDVKIREM